MSERTRMRAGATALFIAPVVLLAGILAHPFVRSYLDTSVVAEAVRGAPGRWALSHLLIAVGLGLLLVAVTVIRREFRDAGEQRWSVVAMPLLFVGATLLGALVGSEVTLAAVATSGQDVLAVLEASETSITPLYLGGALLFAAGWVSLAVAFRRAPILPSVQNGVAVVALIVIPIGLFVPQTSGAYAYGVALLVPNWLIGYRMIADTPASVVPDPTTTRPKLRSGTGR